MNLSEVRLQLTLLGWVKKQDSSKLKDVHTVEMWAKGSQYAYLQPGFDGDDVGAYISYYPSISERKRIKCTSQQHFIARAERDDNSGA